MSNQSTLKKIAILIPALVLMISSQILAQSSSNLNGWVGAGASFKLSKKLSADLSQQVRYKNGISDLDKYFTQAGLRYSLFDGFRVGAKIRYIRDSDDQGNIDGLEKHFRYQFSLSYKHDFMRRLDLSYRLQYQSSSEINVSDVPKERTRLRVGLGYDLKPLKLALKLENEIFYKLGTIEDEENRLNRYRMNLKVGRELGDRNEVEFAYRVQKGINGSDENLKQIISLAFTHKFNFVK